MANLICSACGHDLEDHRRDTFHCPRAGWLVGRQVGDARPARWRFSQTFEMTTKQSPLPSKPISTGPKKPN